MRKVILNLAVSLDGFIEGPNGEYDWCFTDQDYGMTDFMERIDAVLFGRKSYELLIEMDKNPYPDKAKYVFSRTIQALDSHTMIISKEAEEEVKKLKKGDGKDIWLFGGAELTTTFINARLIDELLLSIHPILLGSGKPLFAGLNERSHFKLLDAKTFDTGLVQVSYKLA